MIIPAMPPAVRQYYDWQWELFPYYAILVFAFIVGCGCWAWYQQEHEDDAPKSGLCSLDLEKK